MRISVIGSGTMGTAIAILYASYGYDIKLVNYTKSKTNTQIVEKLRKQVSRIWIEKRIKSKNHLDSLEKIMKNIEVVSDIKKVNNSDIIIESILENLEEKQKLIKSLLKYINSNTIVASNTSSLEINEVFKDYPYKNNIIGIHYFNPVYFMDLVEICVTDNTSQDVVDVVDEIHRKVEKIVIKVSEIKGYIVNNLLIPFINSAAKFSDEFSIKPKDIDSALKLGANHPIGPLKLADLIGLDTLLTILRNLEIEPAESIIDLNNKGYLGRKTLQGFYKYE